MCSPSDLFYVTIRHINPTVKRKTAYALTNVSDECISGAVKERRKIHEYKLLLFTKSLLKITTVITQQLFCNSALTAADTGYPA